MLSCAEKMPAAGRQPMRDSAKTSAESFKKTAATKQGKASVAQACTASAKALSKNASCK
jgi:hypothetical protein